MINKQIKSISHCYYNMLLEQNKVVNYIFELEKLKPELSNIFFDIYKNKYHNLYKDAEKNIKEFNTIEYMQNIILWITEPQILMPKYEKTSNTALMKLLSICRHRNITLVIDTSDSRWVNKGLESYVDVWLIKDQDYQLLKSGSKIRNIINDNMLFSPAGFKIDINEYLMYYRNNEDYQGKFKIGLPRYWNEQYSKPYI